jgi:IPT/TIG domain
MVDTKDSVTPHAVNYLPTPTQHENDLAAAGAVPPIKEYDGSPIDPSSNNPAVPQPPGAPVISSIAPTTGAIPSAPIALTVHGSGFTSAGKVIFNQAAVATTFVSATQLTCSVTAAAAGTYPVEVEDALGFSNTVQFVFTASTQLSESPAARPARRAPPQARSEEP